MKITTLICSFAILIQCLPLVAMAAAGEKTPNILLIITDQQYAEAMSCLGNPRVKTPAADSLAERGVVFTESYCTSPVCSPSRGSVFTGLFPHQNGVDVNGMRIRPELKDLCIEHRLAAKGYECVYAGKWHLSLSKTISKEGLKQHPYRVIAESDDAEVSEACRKYLAEKHDRPFFLVASYLNPHDICLWAMGEEKGYQKFPVPEVPVAQCPPLPANHAISGDEPTVLRDYYMSRHFEYETFNDEKWRQYLHAYYWMVETVDAEIGRLLEGLRSSGLEKDTLVVFTSDHGDGLAAHQWLGKCTHYEEATRVPFIVSYPGRIEPGRVDRTHLISNGPDFYATALDYAGEVIPAGCQGKSLRPLLEPSAGADAWRDQVVSEIWVPANNPKGGEGWISGWGRMLRTAEYKYAVYDRGEHREQLFDMRKDRLETKNLAADPAFREVLETHRQRLAAWCEKTNDEKFLPASASKGGPRIARMIDASRYFRRFPDLVGYRNTSIQKAPAPVLAEVSERELGRAKITRCWLNLDEMWDYRTREFDYNFRIGVDRYKDIPEKFRESWDWESETNIHFDDYLKAFGKHSDEVLLCIRRYERDILDGKLGVTREDWKTLFKNAVRHSKEICPNVRYIEVCNEYGCAGFIGCTPDEYYGFYRLACQAVNEVNAEMKLSEKDRLLVGGPNAVRDAMNALHLFFENFSKDESPDKRLDFVTWHEYHDRYAETAHRQKQVTRMLSLDRLPTDLPMFITEHDPYHPKAGSREYNLINGAGLVKSLYFSSVFSPGVKIMPWVLYHDGEIQTRFMWFEGPNQPDTRAEELRMLPAGCSMKLLGMHRGWEIAVDNAIEDDEIVLASVQNDGLAVQAVNYGEPKDVSLRMEKLSEVFPALGDGELRVVKYLIDEEHSNRVAEPDYPGGIEKVDECRVRPREGTIRLEHPRLSKNGIVFWKVIPAAIGPALNSPVSLTATAAAGPRQPRFDAKKAFDSAVAEPDASIERKGPVVRVKVQRGNGRPGVTFRPASGGWDLSGLGAVEARVRNPGSSPLRVNLALDNPGADRTERKGCVIETTTIPPGEEQVLKAKVGSPPPAFLKTAFRGMRGTPGGFETQPDRGIDPVNVTGISVYMYHPGGNHEFEVSDLRAGKRSEFPLPENPEQMFPMIDRFGQYVHKDWPGKMHSEDDLKMQREREATDLAEHPEAEGWNQYGGWLGGPKLEATGRFRVAKWGGKWWFVDPEGRLFWSHGLVRVTWSCGYTPVTGRRFLFADLPPGDSPFAPFYGRSTWAIRGLYDRGAETYNFSGANLLRKYGADWPAAFSEVTHRRLRSWGLNTMANCSQPAIYLHRETPYTATVYSLDSPPEDTPGGTGYVATIHDDSRVIEAASGGWGKFPDVFDPSFKATLKKEVAQHKGKAVGDPWCLGYFLGNELTWGRDDTWLAGAVLQSPANQPSKKVLIDDLKTKYGKIEDLNAAWDAGYASWDALLKSTAPPDAKKARADLAAFLDKTADAYFRQCREAVKEVDPEGLYLGCRFAGWANERIFAAAAKYSDVISVNRYAESVADLRLPGDADKPVVIGEFHFGALDRGKFHASLRPVPDQQARGEAYEKYVRSALENPLIVGTHWHQFGDQATTGRDDGENFQNGFVDVCDTPYTETVEACRRIGYRLYQVRAGQ